MTKSDTSVNILKRLKISAHIESWQNCIDLIAYPFKNIALILFIIFWIRNAFGSKALIAFCRLVQVMRPSYPDVRAGSSDLNSAFFFQCIIQIFCLLTL